MPAVAWTHTNKDESLKKKSGRGKEYWHWSEVITGMKEETHLARTVKGNTRQGYTRKNVRVGIK